MPREVEVKVRTHNDAVLPERASEHAAGWDIRALEETVVSFRSSVMVPTGLKVAIPERVMRGKLGHARLWGRKV